MYVEDWDSFAAQAEALMRAEPLRTRYVSKYRHSDGKLVLKVTDDRTCVMYATDRQGDLKRVERLNNLFFTLMARGEDAELPAESAPAQPPQQQPRVSAVAPQQPQQPQQAQAAQAGSQKKGKATRRRG